MNHDLTTPTRGERVWLWRMRQAAPNGRTQGASGRQMSAAELGALLGCRAELVTALENDDVEHVAGALTRTERERFDAVYAALVEVYPEIDDLEPTLGERCRLARRRAGVPQHELAALLGGTSRPTAYRLERDGDPTVVDVWTERGFQFEREPT